MRRWAAIPPSRCRQERYGRSSARAATRLQGRPAATGQEGGRGLSTRSGRWSACACSCLQARSDSLPIHLQPGVLAFGEIYEEAAPAPASDVAIELAHSILAGTALGVAAKHEGAEFLHGDEVDVTGLADRCAAVGLDEMHRPVCAIALEVEQGAVAFLRRTGERLRGEVVSHEPNFRRTKSEYLSQLVVDF